MRVLPLLLVSFALGVPATLEAQVVLAGRHTNVWEGWSVGAALGRSGNEDEHHASKDRGADLRGNVEIPLGSRWVARVEAGRVSWEYDQYGPDHLLRDDVVTVRRATVGALWVTDPASPVRGYLGAGVGLYNWNATVGTMEKSVTRGTHFTMGLALPVYRRAWAITGELQVHVINSPNRAARPIPEGPVSGTAVLSLTHSIGFRLFL